MNAAAQPPPGANPYPGLRSFERDESDRFHGRREQIETLADRVTAQRLVAVSGASGCGKSSLVKAGLLAELDRRSTAASAWRWLVMRPGNRPMARLAEALAPALRMPGAADAHDPLRIDALHGRLLQGRFSLVESVQDAQLPEGTRLLVVVDQFEELFRMRQVGPDEAARTDEAAAFVKLLLQASEAPGAPVHVVLTLRSDTLGSCAEFPGLPEAVSVGTYLVPRQTRAQRKEAIVGPAEGSGCKVAPRLVQRLLNDVSDQFDDLPILQHALSRTWAQWARQGQPEQPMDLVHYQAVLGDEGALSLHADEAFNEIVEHHQDAALVERVFRMLTQRVSGGLELRRPVELRQLCEACDDGGPDVPARVRRIVDRYRRPDTAFLVPVGERPLADTDIIDISHESLIRQWKRLGGWLESEADSARTYQRLADDAERRRKGKFDLLGQPELDEALAWRDREHPNAAWAARYQGDFALAMDLLDDSRAADRERRRRDHQRTRSWIAAGALSFLLLLFFCTAWIARDQEVQEARREASRATLDSLRFFELLHAAAQARQNGTTGDAQLLCGVASVVAGKPPSWRTAAFDEACTAPLPLKDTGRLLANVRLGRGEIRDAVKQLARLEGDSAVRVFVNLQRIATLDLPEMRSERERLVQLWRKTTGSKERHLCATAEVSYLHPVHAAMARGLCREPDSAGAASAPGAGDAASAASTASVSSTGLDLQHRRLMLTYVTQIEPGAAAAAAVTLRTGATEEVKPYTRADAEARPSVTRLENWFYAQVARAASRPFTLGDRAADLGHKLWTDWRYELLLLAAAALWQTWRRLRGPAASGGASPPLLALRRALAMLLDLGLSAALLVSGLWLVRLGQSALAREDGWLSVLPLAVVALTLLTLGFAYLLMGDLLPLRYERSVGKVVFDLRILSDTPAPTRGDQVMASVRRNAPLLPVLLLVVALAVEQLAAPPPAPPAGSTAPVASATTPFEAATSLGPLRLALLLVGAGAMAGLLLFNGRSVGDRWSRTRVIDADSPESLATDRLPRYRAAAPLAAA